MKLADLPVNIQVRFEEALLRLETEASFPLLTNKGEELDEMLQQIVADAYEQGRDSGYAEGLSAGRSVGFSEGYEAACTQDPTRL